MAKANEDKREVAKALFLHSKLTQREIAQRLHITEKTMSTWVIRYKWDELKAVRVITREQLVKNAYTNIMSIQELAELQRRALTPAETDQLLKLAKLIEVLDNRATVAVIIEVFTMMEEYLAPIDLEFTKQLNRYHQDFINVRLK